MVREPLANGSRTECARICVDETANLRCTIREWFAYHSPQTEICQFVEQTQRELDVPGVLSMQAGVRCSSQVRRKLINHVPHANGTAHKRCDRVYEALCLTSCSLHLYCPNYTASNQSIVILYSWRRCMRLDLKAKIVSNCLYPSWLTRMLVSRDAWPATLFYAWYSATYSHWNTFLDQIALYNLVFVYVLDRRQFEKGSLNLYYTCKCGAERERRNNLGSGKKLKSIETIRSDSKGVVTALYWKWLACHSEQCVQMERFQ